MFKRKKKISNENKNKLEDNNDQQENASNVEAPKKNTLRKLKKTCVNNLPLIASGVGGILTLATGVAVDGFQCADVSTAGSVAVSTGILGCVMKGAIKQKKQERIQALESEEKVNEDRAIEEKELAELKLARLKIETLKEQLKAEKLALKLSQVKLAKLEVDNSIDLNTSSSNFSQNWFQSNVNGVANAEIISNYSWSLPSQKSIGFL